MIESITFESERILPEYIMDPKTLWEIQKIQNRLDFCKGNFWMVLDVF